MESFYIYRYDFIRLSEKNKLSRLNKKNEIHKKHQKAEKYLKVYFIIFRVTKLRIVKTLSIADKSYVQCLFTFSVEGYMRVALHK